MLNIRRLPAKILNSILMIFTIPVAVRWGPQSAQIEKCKGETPLVGPFYIGFRRKKWVLGVFLMSHPNRSGACARDNHVACVAWHVAHACGCWSTPLTSCAAPPHTCTPAALTHACTHSVQWQCDLTTKHGALRSALAVRTTATAIDVSTWAAHQSGTAPPFALLRATATHGASQHNNVR